jgi:hypothetical protein
MKNIKIISIINPYSSHWQCVRNENRIIGNFSLCGRREAVTATYNTHKLRKCTLSSLCFEIIGEFAKIINYFAYFHVVITENLQRHFIKWSLHPSTYLLLILIIFPCCLWCCNMLFCFHARRIMQFHYWI